MSPVEIITRLIAAALCGALIGWNREREDKPAGLRTHMLVSLGSAAFTLINLGLVRGEQGDTTRIVQGIATGIGFLGAGSIFRSQDRVHGMTTAAGIWVVGAIGLACGAGAYVVAGATSILTFVILSLAVRLESRITDKR
jgi:putative Mg2+ transporter-C (MgtC) family protein